MTTSGPSLRTALEGGQAGDIADGILRAVQSLRDAAASGELQARAEDLLESGEDRLADLLKIAPDAEARERFREEARAGLGVGGLALLLSGRAARRNTAALAGLGALGALTFAAYRANGDRLPTSKDELIGLLRGEDDGDRDLAILTAQVAAARHVGLTGDDLREQLRGRATPEEIETIAGANPGVGMVAALATSTALAEDIYRVSARIAGGGTEAGRDYLDRLAMAMELDPDTAARIEVEGLS